MFSGNSADKHLRKKDVYHKKSTKNVEKQKKMLTWVERDDMIRKSLRGEEIFENWTDDNL